MYTRLTTDTHHLDPANESTQLVHVVVDTEATICGQGL
jgi:hypothetical protein